MGMGMSFGNLSRGLGGPVVVVGGVGLTHDGQLTGLVAAGLGVIAFNSTDEGRTFDKPLLTLGLEGGLVFGPHQFGLGRAYAAVGVGPLLLGAGVGFAASDHGASLAFTPEVTWPVRLNIGSAMIEVEPLVRGLACIWNERYHASQVLVGFRFTLP
jgi:hypothetical protein